eukprot:gnl/TRDRNA2_/TRDRNA2_172670_c1_seq5.p1 gnl/TRDRNA2_/TRDRNA2_172670_c1~~gnl/TRDRNA2_/TRDRNA2_172670_c1_seq5.p1  ORF type:complete len:174 (+),score=14.28 gnl/TRDRNA2_/TRDRNA2_172670_c1_seq5:393-914(+)
MGTMLLYKFLLTDLAKKVDRIVLLEPVVNGWIRDAGPGYLSKLPSLELYGAHGRVLRDTKGNVEKSVKRFLPNCKVHLLKDLNHLGLISWPETGEIGQLLHSLATKDLPNHVTPKQLRAEIVEQIAVFLGWQRTTGKSDGAHSLHNITSKKSRAKIALQRHAKDRHTRSRLQH